MTQFETKLNELLLRATGKTEFSGPFDCNRCEMIAPQGLTRDLGPFLKDLKCCTYQPFIPNYSIFEVASLRNITMRQLICELQNMSLRYRFQPLGAIPERSQNSICEMGKDRQKRCQFLTDETNPRCSIFSARSMQCRTYRCKGFQNQTELRHELLGVAKLDVFEKTVSYFLALQHGFTGIELESDFLNHQLAAKFYEDCYVSFSNLPSAALAGWL